MILEGTVLYMYINTYRLHISNKIDKNIASTYKYKQYVKVDLASFQLSTFYFIVTLMT